MPIPSLFPSVFYFHHFLILPISPLCCYVFLLVTFLYRSTALVLFIIVSLFLSWLFYPLLPQPSFKSLDQFILLLCQLYDSLLPTLCRHLTIFHELSSRQPHHQIPLGGFNFQAELTSSPCLLLPTTTGQLYLNDFQLANLLLGSSLPNEPIPKSFGPN